MTEKQFVEGIIFRLPSEKAPDFIKMNGSMKRVQLMTWLAGRSEEFVNFEVKVSQKGAVYCEVSAWKPKPADGQEQKSKILNDDIPF